MHKSLVAAAVAFLGLAAAAPLTVGAQPQNGTQTVRVEAAKNYGERDEKVKPDGKTVGRG